MSHRQNVLQVFSSKQSLHHGDYSYYWSWMKELFPLGGCKVRDNPWGIACAILLYQYEMSVHVSTQTHARSHVCKCAVHLGGLYHKRPILVAVSEKMG